MPTQNLMDATSALPQVLVTAQLTTSEVTYYTGPANSAVKVSSARLTNTNAPGGAAATIGISLVKTGGTAGNSNRVLNTYSLAAGDGIDLPELKDAFLGPGDFISAIASAGTTITLVITGVVFS